MLKMLTDSDFWGTLVLTYLVLVILAWLGLGPQSAAALLTTDNS